MKNNKLLGLALIVVMAVYFGHHSAWAQQSVEYELNLISDPYWNDLKSATPAIDMPSLANSAEQLGLNKEKLTGFLLQAFAEVYQHPIDTAKKLSEQGDNDLYIYFSTTTSPSEIGQMLAQHIKMIHGSVEKLRNNSTDGYTFNQGVIKKENNQLIKRANVELFIDLMLDKYKTIPYQQGSETTKAQKLMLFYLYTQTVLAHEVYGNAVSHFNRTKNDVLYFNSLYDTKNKILTEAARLKKLSDLRHELEQQAYQAGIDYLQALLKDSDRMFEIQAQMGNYFPAEDDVTYAEIQNMIKVLINYEKEALKGWQTKK